MTTKKTPTAEQVIALRHFAAKHGRNWKAALRHIWQTGQTQYEENAAELQRVRNEFGAAWLADYKI